MNAPLARTLTSTERRDWLRLIRSERVGPITFFRLLERFGSAAAALERLPELARRGGASGFKICPSGEAEDEIAALDKIGARLVARGEPDYPSRLAHIEDAPPLIAVLGRTPLLQGRGIGVVGARNASLNGSRFAEALARDLGQAGFVVVSGFARGIDAAAHKGALASGTVAAHAGGIDVVYPRENAALYDRMREEGTMISEAPPGAQPIARLFVSRNRLISGMSEGVVVVEAAQRSGALITTRFALEQGREVFAVPGAPTDPRAKGCNDLLRQGAILTEGADDVIAALNIPLRTALAEPPESAPESAPQAPPEAGELARAREIIVINLSPSPVPVDEIIRCCQFSPAVVATVLLELELAGRLERHPGNQVSLLASERIATR